MKRLLSLILFFLLSYTLRAQTVSDVQNLLWLTEFTSAEEIAKKTKLKDPEMAYWYIQSLLLQNKIADASKAMAELAKAHPKDKLLMIAKGQVMLQEGKTAEAKALFNEQLNSSGNEKAVVSVAIGRAYANASMKNCDPDFAISILKDAMALQPGNGLVYIYTGDCYRRKLEGGEALQSYLKAMEVDKGLEAMANYKIALIHLTQDNCDFTSRHLTSSLKANATFLPSIKTFYEMTVNTESQCYNQEKAKLYYNDYTKIAPAGFETEMFKVRHLYGVQDYSGALLSIKELQKKWPDHFDNGLHAMAGRCYAAQNDFPNAIIALEKYLAGEKNAENISYTTMVFLAKAYAATGNSEKTKATYLKAVDMAKELHKKIQLLDTVAAEDIKGKKHNEAALIYEQIISLKKAPSAADYYKCGTAWYQGGEIQKSKKVFHTYAEKFPSDWRAPYYIANNEALLDTTLSVGSAVPFYEKAIVLGSNDLSAKKALIQSHWYLFGYAYQVKKNTTNALKHLDAILVLEPTHPEAIKYRKLLAP